MLTIAIIGTKGLPAKSGGVEKHVAELVTGLIERSHRVLVYSRPWYTGSWHNKKIRGAEIISLPSIPTKHLDAITHSILAGIDVLFRKADIIHVHGIGPSLILPFIKLFSRARIIATLHSQDYHHQKWGWLARLALRFGEMSCCRFADETIVVSRELERYTWSAYQKVSTYIPNGTSIPETKPVSLSTLNKFGLEKNKYILFVGRLVRHKGVHYLIEAYQKLETNLPLVIVGASAHTADYVKYLNRLANKNPNIKFLGEQTGKNLATLYAGARTVVQPSASEGISLVLLEAMSHARPVVVSNIPGNLEVVGDNGIIFHRYQSNDLAKKLNWIIKHPRLGVTLGEKNRERVKKLYNWPNIVEATENLYYRSMRTKELKTFSVRPLTREA